MMYIAGIAYLNTIVYESVALYTPFYDNILFQYS
ncbi:hypothetical protein CHRYSEOSP005_27050 [Chryseobacterium sp. Alg-005]